MPAGKAAVVVAADGSGPQAAERQAPTWAVIGQRRAGICPERLGEPVANAALPALTCAGRAHSLSHDPAGAGVDRGRLGECELIRGAPDHGTGTHVGAPRAARDSAQHRGAAGPVRGHDRGHRPGLVEQLVHGGDPHSTTWDSFPRWCCPARRAGGLNAGHRVRSRPARRRGCDRILLLQRAHRDAGLTGRSSRAGQAFTSHAWQVRR